ncbi:MAG: hypothetical protein ACFFB2_20790, partial [Promethearchaeota archaeon]
HSLSEILDSLLTKDRQEILEETLRELIWSAIKERYSGASFVFNYQMVKESYQHQIFELERVLSSIFKESYGFPLYCACFQDSSANIVDLLPLMKFHTDLKLYNASVDEKNVGVTPIIKSPFISERSVGENEQLNLQFEETNSELTEIASKAFSESNDPFYIKGTNGNPIGVAKSLTSLLYQLENAPLNVFHYHCYRMTPVDLEGNTIVPIPRSDIPLWIEYSLGDTVLAHQIYRTIFQTIGYNSPPEIASTFTKSITRTNVLNLIRSRLDQLRERLYL